MSYRIEYKSSVKKELRKLAKPDRIAVIRKIQLLKMTPKPPGSTRLKGSGDLFRIRHGNYRIIYQVINKKLIISVIKVGHRR